MTRYIVLITETLSADEETAIASALTDPVGWFHWLPNSWLVNDPGDRHDATTIRAIFAEAAPMKQCVAFDVQPTMWTGRINEDEEGRQMEVWLNAHWAPWLN